MQALILNSGIGSRLGTFTAENHKCMICVDKEKPLIFYQMDTLLEAGVNEFIITVGYRAEQLVNLLQEHYKDKCTIHFVDNPKFKTSNYIYSLYLALSLIRGNVLLIHGDLYFEKEVLEGLTNSKESKVIIESTLPCSSKDFNAEIRGGIVERIGTYVFGDGCYRCQPMYYLTHDSWCIWAEQIRLFCGQGNVNVYAEEALNMKAREIGLVPHDVKGKICMEIDTMEDLKFLRSQIEKRG